jgi:MFS family permease
MTAARQPRVERPRDLPQPDSYLRRSLVLATVAVLLAAADTYVVVVALPAIAGGVGISLTSIARAEPIVTAFLVGYVAVLPLIGRLSDLVGRQPVLIGCLLVFAGGSLLVATAHALPTVLIGRGLQGLGGGGLVPATLALVADGWTSGRRGAVLGVVGAAQEVGALSGPLLGAGILALASWRAIFVVNLAVALVLAGLLAVVAKSRLGRDPIGIALAILTVAASVLVLWSPAALVDDVTAGALFVPAFGHDSVTSPIGLIAVGAALLLTLNCAISAHPLIPLRRVAGVARRVDTAGAALLAAGLTAFVVVFSPADPDTSPVARSWLLFTVVSAVALVAFAVRQRLAREPLLDLAVYRRSSAWGPLAVSFFVGAALIAILVDVPVFARLTAYPSSQTGAALVLLRFLVGVPVGAVVGGWLLERIPAAAIAAAGCVAAGCALLFMTRWGPHAVGGVPVRGSDVALLGAGLGIGLAIAPVNAALLGAVPSDVHGSASSLIVVFRTAGQLVGLSASTALGLRAFDARIATLPTPTALCPTSPANCPAYVHLARAAAVAELHAVMLAAACCAFVAAGVAIVTIRSNPQVAI